MELVTQFATITEMEIIERILSGELSLFEILVRRNNPYLYKTGRSYGLSHEDTEDIMQDTFISAYQHLGEFRHHSSFKTWLTRIMLNNCYHRSRKAGMKRVNSDDISREKIQASSVHREQSLSDELVSKKEFAQIIEEALLQIPPNYRMVFSLRELSGLSTTETAELLYISPINVKVRLTRARHMLRKAIEKMYSPEEIFEFNLVYCDRIAEQVLKAIQSGENS